MMNSVYTPPLNPRRPREMAGMFPINRLTSARQTRPDMGVIMIVDDCPPLRNILSRMVSLAGYRSILAPNAMEALKKCRLRQPDLILLDVNLPAVNGLYTQLRQEPATRSIPIILTGVYGTGWSQRLVKAEGAVDFLTIPASYKTLLGRVERWLRQ